MFSSSNIQSIPTPILWLASIFGSTPGVVVLGTGISALANAQQQTVAFGSTLPAVASLVILVWIVPAGGTANVISGDIVDASITTTGFDVNLQAAPGDTLHKVGWIAIA